MSDIWSGVGNFAKGFGHGVWSGATGMVKGIGAIGEGLYDVATDPSARAAAWNDAVSAAKTAEWAVENPGQAARDVGQGAEHLYDNFVTAEQQASANGQGAEFWGNVLGQGAFAAGTVLVPGLAEAKLAGTAGELGEVAEGANALEGAAALTDEGAGTSFLLRGDARPPSDIFENGFQPRGGDASLEDYVFDNAPSQYVGLTSDPGQAANFATDFGNRPGFVYATDAQPNGIVVNDALGDASPYPWEQETAVPGGVPNTQIRGATPIAPDGTLGDSSLLNPNYAGSAPETVGPIAPDAGAPSVLNGGALAGAGILGAGTAGNAVASDPQEAGDLPKPDFTVTYGVNPDGSLFTISPPTPVAPAADVAPAAAPEIGDDFGGFGVGGGGGGGGGFAPEAEEMDVD